MNKLCPFRKQVIYYDCEEDQEWVTPQSKSYYSKEEFLPCIKDECIAYSVDTNLCQLCNKMGA